MVEHIRKRFAVIFLTCSIVFFYAPFLLSFISGNYKLPIPLDTVVGLYHPYRDFYSATYQNGIPFKNFLITDPVRQTMVWKELVIDIAKRGDLPTWNPYEMTGKPLIANFQSGFFYPLNLILFFLPFRLGWSFIIVSQSILATCFTYLYLRNLKLNSSAAALGAGAFTFSGFSISWLEWGTIVSTGLWLPFILFSIDKSISAKGDLSFYKLPKIKSSIFWAGCYLFGMLSSFAAGHLQTFFYIYIVSLLYVVFRLLIQKRKKALYLFAFANGLIFILGIFQWLPTLQFINLSARMVDQGLFLTEGWFLPYSHLIQFVAPDFFGNPATLNYWGTWNYGEFVGYIGVLPLILTFFAFLRKNSTVFFFGGITFFSLLFALPTGISSLPYVLEWPFISTAQPSRLIFLVSFSLSILSAFGASYLYNTQKIKWKEFIPIIVISGIFILCWLLVVNRPSFIFHELQQVVTAQRNLIFPTIILCVSIFCIILMLLLKKKIHKEILMSLLLLITFLELLRFAQKFTPFTRDQYYFPYTTTIERITSDRSPFRVAVMDRRIMPPNFFTHYKIQTIEGYDPLYLKSYAEYIVALERNTPNITKPYGFNRIITPHNYDSDLFDFLNTKYILSMDELNSPKLIKLLDEGQTKLYLNTKYYPRVYFVDKVIVSNNVIQSLFKEDLKTTAIVEASMPSLNFTKGEAIIENYSESKVVVKTINSGQGFLVFSDAYYPSWRVYIDGVEREIIKTNHAFRGVVVPPGNHTILFKDNLF